MIDFKKTLTNLHNEFPEFDLDTLFKITDAIVETPTITIPSGIRYPLDKSQQGDGMNKITWTYDTQYNVK